MPRPRRIQFPGAYYHVFNRGVEKRTIVLDERDRRTFLHLLGETIRQFHLRLFAYCLMDNHYHFFLQTPEANLTTAMQSFQGLYAHYVNLRYQRVGSLFQDRFKSPAVDADLYALALVRYIHHNPLEAGITNTLDEYPWSSYPVYSGHMPAQDWLDTAWILALFHDNPSQAHSEFRIFHERRRPTAIQDLFHFDH